MECDSLLEQPALPGSKLQNYKEKQKQITTSDKITIVFESSMDWGNISWEARQFDSSDHFDNIVSVTFVESL